RRSVHNGGMTLDHDHAAHAHGEHDHGHDHEHEHEHEHDDHAGHEHVDYSTAVEMFRADKDDYFRRAQDSPIPHAQRHDFPGLPSSPGDESLRCEGLPLEPYSGSEPTSFQIPTSDGRLRDADRAGTLAFSIGGAQQRLTGYRFKNDRSGSVFVPFL